MKNLLFVAALGFLATTIDPGRSEAAGYTSGNICSSANFGGTPVSISLDPYGATNPSTSATLAVNCPMPDSGTSTNLGFQLLAYDRSTIDDVECTVKGFESDGSFVFSTTLSTVSGGPGSGLQVATAALPPFSTAKIFTAHCSLPAMVPLSGIRWYSHIVGLRIF